MAYCTQSDVRLLITTSIEDADITSLITHAQEDLDSMLGGTTFDTAQKKIATMRLTAALILERGQDTYSETESRRQLLEAAERHRAMVRKMIRKGVPRWRTVDPLE